MRELLREAFKACKEHSFEDRAVSCQYLLKYVKITISLLTGPQRMITVPPRHYCLVVNPVMRGQDAQVLLDNVGQVNYD